MKKRERERERERQREREMNLKKIIQTKLDKKHHERNFQLWMNVAMNWVNIIFK